MATMDRDSRIPKFDGSDYVYWKTRMRAYLKGKGADIWAIVNATNFSTDSAVQSHHDANNKALDILLSSLSRNEFDRVCDLEIAHKIWSRLQSFHEGTNAVKARLFETYRREYENFVQLPGESVETLFSRFQSCVNKMRDNIIKMPYEDHDLALKLLHALDRSVWGVKVDAVIESANYETLTLEDLYSKLRSTEIDIKSRAKLESPPTHNTALVSDTRSSSSNPSLGAFSLSSLLSVSEEQVDELEDEELALITKRFMRFNDNRRFRRKNNNCFECGKPGHFAIDCPSKNKSKGEYDYSKYKNNSGKPKHKNKKKHSDRDKKEFHKKKAKARAFASLSDVDSESETSSDSSSSEEEDVGKRKKDGRNFTGLCFYSKSRQARGEHCVMAIDADGETSDPEPDSEVTDTSPTREQLVLEVDELNECLINQDKLIKRAARERNELKARLETALHEIEVFKSTSVAPDVLECNECETHMASLASLKSKYANLVDELDKTKTALNEAKTGPILLRPCESCSALKKELDDAHARINLLEKSCSSSSQNALVECDVCPALLQELDDFKYALTNTKDENTHLRSVLGWVSAREPQLGMLLSQFKRGDGYGVGFDYNRVSFDYGKIGECSGLSPSEKPAPSSQNPPKLSETHTPNQVINGVFQETSKEPPKKQVWTEKPNHLRNPLDTLPPAAKKHPAPKPRTKPQSRVPPQPKIAERYHCSYCHKEGHLEEFCFRRKRDERREKEQKNKDMYYPFHGVHEPAPRGSVRRAAQPRGVREDARRAR